MIKFSVSSAATVTVTYVEPISHTIRSYQRIPVLHVVSNVYYQDGSTLVAAAMTVTADRAEDVNFLHPFENLGFTVVVKRDWAKLLRHKQWLEGFSVFHPVTPAVWAITFISVIVVSIVHVIIIGEIYNEYNNVNGFDTCKLHYYF